jgi:nucleotide-binding universal stress UspA family protein
MNQARILAVVDENGRSTERCIERLAEKVRGVLYLVYVKDVHPYPAEVLLELEKRYNDIKSKGTGILKEISAKAEKLGFKTEILGVHCGIAAERILKLEKQLNPDIILVEYECSPLKRLFSSNYVDTLFCKAKAPVMVAR